MIKCYFVDVKNISSDLPRSSFVESELEQLANLILATDGLLRPLILKENGIEKYTIVEGHREYYAALRAKEKDSRKAEMVNAFVISSQIQQSAVAQLSLLNEAKLSIPIPAIDPTDSIVEQLLPTLLAAISQLIQPMVAQLVEQKQILDKLTKEKPDPKSKDGSISPLPIPVVIINPELTDTKKIEPDKIIQPNPPDEKEHPISKEDNALNLVNTLDLDRLILRMTQSGIPSAKKLAANIIAARNDQPEQTFETWKIVTAKVSGLGSATTQKIIDKLK